jgi:hypothetical protein
MKYFITVSTGQTHLLDLPVNDSISWEEFENIPQVKALNCAIIDITPDGMPDRFTDGEIMMRQLRNVGMKVTRNGNGVGHYETIADDELLEADDE